MAERATALPKGRQVYVADREADILALLVKARDLKYAADYLVRCKQNRALPRGDKLWARLIAKLGGFLCRKADGKPGAKTLWLGLRDIAVFVEGARFTRAQHHQARKG